MILSLCYLHPPTTWSNILENENSRKGGDIYKMVTKHGFRTIINLTI